MRHDLAMPHPRPGFRELGVQQLQEPVHCHECRADVMEARVMERPTRRGTAWLYDCPSCGNNLWGGNGAPDTPSPTLE